MTSRPEENLTPEQITDEMLMAYVDGDPEQPARRRRQISAALPHSPELVRRLACFLFTKGPVQRVFEQTLVAPERLVAAVAGDTRTAPKPRAGASVLDVFRTPRWRVPMWAMAAVGAILLAGASGLLVRDAMRQDIATLEQRRAAEAVALQQALETTPTGQLARVASDLSLRPRATFSSRPGSSQRARWCRIYDAIDNDGMVAPGVACRGDEGVWRVHVQEPAGPPKPQAEPAGEEAGAARAYRDRIMTGRPLTTGEEKSLMGEKRWKRQP